VESKWKNYHIKLFLDSLSPKNMRDASSGDTLKIALFGELSLEEAMDLSRDRQILELEPKLVHTLFLTGVCRLLGFDAM
jgi:hypothetical protein